MPVLEQKGQKESELLAVNSFPVRLEGCDWNQPRGLARFVEAGEFPSIQSELRRLEAAAAAGGTSAQHALELSGSFTDLRLTIESEAFLDPAGLKSELLSELQLLRREAFALVAQEIVRRDLGVEDRPLPIGEGYFSNVYAVGGFAVLVSNLPAKRDSYGDYRRQFALSRLAQQAGVRVPRVHGIGSLPVPYTIMELAAGRPLHEVLGGITDSKERRRFQKRAERHLGRELNKLHSVELKKFGWLDELRRGDGAAVYRGYTSSWRDYIDSQLCWNPLGEAVNPTLQPLKRQILELGVLQSKDLRRAAKVVAKVRGWKVKPCLIHGDFHFGNVLSGADGITLIDWGLAKAGGGLIEELAAQVNSEDVPQPGRFRQFMEGYGVGRGKQEALERKIFQLGYVKIMSNAMWIMQNLPDNREQVRAVLQRGRKVLRTCC